jgi:protein MPE1
LDGKPRIKRTTGIPKSFLQTVDASADNQTGLMVAADGSFVVARPDS